MRPLKNPSLLPGSMCWSSRPEWAVVAGLAVVGGLALLGLSRWIADRLVREMEGGIYGPVGRLHLRLQGRTGTALGVVVLGCMMVGVGALAVHACLSAP